MLGHGWKAIIHLLRPQAGFFCNPLDTADKFKHFAQEWVWTDIPFSEGSIWLHTLLIITVFDPVKIITTKNPRKNNHQKHNKQLKTPLAGENLQPCRFALPAWTSVQTAVPHTQSCATPSDTCHTLRWATPFEMCHTLRDMPRSQRCATPSEMNHALRDAPRPLRHEMPSDMCHALRAVPHPQGCATPLFAPPDSLLFALLWVPMLPGGLLITLLLTRGEPCPTPLLLMRKKKKNSLHLCLFVSMEISSKRQKIYTIWRETRVLINVSISY